MHASRCVGPDSWARIRGSTVSLTMWPPPGKGRKSLRSARDDAPVLIVDAANVIGSRPNGWWRDRAGAAQRFVADLRAAARTGRVEPPVIVVLEGKSRAGVGEDTADGVEVVHARGEGDDTIVSVATAYPGSTVVTADRALSERVHAVDGDVRGPRWLLDLLDLIVGQD